MDGAGSNVDRLYETLRRMAADFAFKPGARINESALAQRLRASRTPVREALNRLAAEGFLTASGGRGFRCRPLSPERILELYEARVAVECEIARLACRRGGPERIARFAAWFETVAPDYTPRGETARLLEADEEFHRRLAALAGNAELSRMLDNLADRIRYVRMIDLRRMQAGAAGRPDMLAAHRRILDAVIAADPEAAAAAMRRHIERRRDEATEAVRAAYAQLYVPDDGGDDDGTGDETDGQDRRKTR